MADRKITDLTALAAGSQATGDLLTIVDVSEAAATDKNKKITVENLFKGIPSNVGIGTSSPSGLLHVSGQDTSVRIQTSAGTLADMTNDTHQRIAFQGGNAELGLFKDSSGNFSYVLGTNQGSTDIPLVFKTSSRDEQMRIDSSGNVGINSTAPRTKLSVLNGSSGYSAGAGLGSGAIACLESNGNVGLQFLSNSSYSNYIYFGDQSSASTGSIQYSHGANALIFSVNGGTERLRIDSSGQVGIGTSSPGDYGNFADDLVIYNSSQPGITLATGTSGYGSIYFADGTVGNAASRGQIQYNHSNDSLLFATAASERMRIGSDGNCSIGTTSNPNKLRVHQGSDNANIIIATGADESSEFISLGIDSGVPTLTAGGVGSTDAPLAFRTSDSGTESERMRIDSSGRLLVGASSSSGVGAKLQVIGDLGAQFHRGENSAGGASITLSKSRNTTYGSNTIVQDDDTVGIVAFRADDGTDYSSYAAFIGCHVDGTPGANDMPGRLVFSTTADGASSPTERMRITKDGHLLLGQSTTQVPGFGSTTVGCAFEALGSDGGAFFSSRANGPAYFGNRNNDGNLHECRRSGNFVGSISVNSSSTAFNTSSDHRLKENVVALSGAIDRVKQLLPKRFNFIVDADTTVDGFLAHEAQTVVPEAVTGTHNEVDDDGNAVMQGIDQSKLVPLLTAALQEAIAEIETLKTKVAALEAG